MQNTMHKCPHCNKTQEGPGYCLHGLEGNTKVKMQPQRGIQHSRTDSFGSGNKGKSFNAYSE